MIGRIIAGKYEIESLLGSGAMGAVYRARQTSLDKTVAIKVLHGEHADDPTFAARFQREAKAASRLNHPNSMAVIDFGAEPDGLLYIAMEYLDGKNLFRILKDEWPLAPARIADIVAQTLAALAVAHDMGVVHRDLKPENIMVLRGTNDDGQPTDLVKVCDFGIAKITDSRGYRSGDARESSAPVTTAGFLVGTPEYMSPEQGRGEKLDPRSDLYSVGVIVYQLLTGSVPFEAENAIGVVLKHITDEPAPPSSIAPACHEHLAKVCMRALRKPREERYQNAREMRAEVRAAVSGSRPTPVDVQAPDRGPSVRLKAAGALAGTGHARTVTELEARESAAAQVAASAPSAAYSAPGAVSEAPKMTLTGTAAPIPGLPRRRRLVALVSVIVGLLAALLVYVGMTRMRARSNARDSSRGAPPLLAQSTGAAQASDTSASADPRTGGTSSSARALPPHGLYGAASVGAPLHSASAGASAVSSASAAPSASAASIGSAAPTTAVDPPEPPPAPTPPPTPTGEPEPPYNPDSAYVVVGMVNAQGVRDNGVRAALHQANFTGCYRTALRGYGHRAHGVATLSLSIDENGAVRGAVLTGADFLPSVRACVQSAAYGIHVAKRLVDPGGGTADVILQFNAPAPLP